MPLAALAAPAAMQAAGGAGGPGGGAPDQSSASSGPANAGGTNSWTVNVQPPRFGNNWIQPLAIAGVVLGGLYLWSRKK